MEANSKRVVSEAWRWALGVVLLLGALVFGARLVAGQEVPPDMPAETDPSRATLAGEVLIGPTCPVVRVDQPTQCQDKPYAATLSIQSADGTLEITQVATDDQGQFSVELDPGTYLLVPLGVPGHILPRGIPQTVTLAAGDVAAVVVHYDSGMR